MEKILKILIITSDIKLCQILHFCLDGWGYEVIVGEKTCCDDITLIKKIFPDVIIVDIQSAKEPDLKICTLLRSDFLTSSIPIITLINKRHLRSNLLNLKYGVDDYLIKPPDPLDLRIRIEMAARRLNLSFYANPLTGLPGANVLEEVILERLKKKSEFVVAYVDIDNFKYFNDAYGYLKGDNVIMHTAYILYTTIKRFGNSNDFIAHIGGDDFAFLTTFDKYEEICQNFIFIFDKVIPFHYSKTDRLNKFIVSKDRTGMVRKIPLMSVSLAIVPVKKDSDINSVVKINEKIAEIKKYLKTLRGSKYMLERRSFVTQQNGPYIHRETDIDCSYKPLGQIFLENNIISEEQLNEALRLHWRRGVVLGQILTQMHYVDETQLNKILELQKSLLKVND
ncbi:MAG: diguanylate cyclase [Candidatus Omnitrophica bacterium]|nr:diguanylate cyclase [Candidatus Omnitrophota bacterium]